MEARYVFNDPWRFVLQVRPHMITHIRMADPELESALQKLQAYKKQPRIRLRIKRLTQGRSYRWRSYREYKNPLKNMPLYRILEAAYNDNI